MLYKKEKFTPPPVYNSKLYVVNIVLPSATQTFVSLWNHNNFFSIQTIYPPTNNFSFVVEELKKNSNYHDSDIILVAEAGKVFPLKTFENMMQYIDLMTRNMKQFIIFPDIVRTDVGPTAFIGTVKSIRNDLGSRRNHTPSNIYDEYSKNPANFVGEIMIDDEHTFFVSNLSTDNLFWNIDSKTWLDKKTVTFPCFVVLNNQNSVNYFYRYIANTIHIYT